jgi:hypothetical protein
MVWKQFGVETMPPAPGQGAGLGAPHTTYGGPIAGAGAGRSTDRRASDPIEVILVPAAFIFVVATLGIVLFVVARIYLNGGG